MNGPVGIRRLLEPTDAEIQGLAEVLIDCVHGGASVSFMSPLSLDKAVAFWRGIAAQLAHHRRALLIAEDAQGIIGTVQLIFDLPENQPHRADLSKMLVHRRARRRGVGDALLRAAEDPRPRARQAAARARHRERRCRAALRSSRMDPGGRRSGLRVVAPRRALRHDVLLSHPRAPGALIKAGRSVPRAGTPPPAAQRSRSTPASCDWSAA